MWEQWARESFPADVVADGHEPVVGGGGSRTASGVTTTWCTSGDRRRWRFDDHMADVRMQPRELARQGTGELGILHRPGDAVPPAARRVDLVVVERCLRGAGPTDEHGEQGVIVDDDHEPRNGLFVAKARIVSHDPWRQRPRRSRRATTPRPRLRPRAGPRTHTAQTVAAQTFRSRPGVRGAAALERQPVDEPCADGRRPVYRVQVTIFPVITGQTGVEPIFQDVADFDLELLESRTLERRTQELIYRPTMHI
jgi:hypothetical protein